MKNFLITVGFIIIMSLVIIAILWAIVTLSPHKAMATEWIEPINDCTVVGQYDGDHGGIWQSPLPTSGDDAACPSESPSPTPKPTIEPSATPSATPAPKGPDALSPAGPPSGGPTCGDQSVTQNVLNPLIWRKGDQAKVQWWPTSGSQVNIYYKQVSSPVWQYSLRNQPNNGFAVINGLGTLDITFAVEQINNCAGGPVNLVKIVDGYSDSWHLFVP